MDEWKEIAFEYKREIEDLWVEMDKALDACIKGTTRSVQEGLDILENSLVFSEKYVRILSNREPYENGSCKLKPIVKIAECKVIEEIKERPKDEDRFKWIYSN